MKFLKIIFIFILSFGIAFNVCQSKTFQENEVSLCETDQLTEIDEIEEAQNDLRVEETLGNSLVDVFLSFHVYPCSEPLHIEAVASLILSKTFSKQITHSPPVFFFSFA